MSFDSGWRAFEQDDRATRAPVTLERRVFAALESTRTIPHSRPHWRLIPAFSLAVPVAFLIGWLAGSNSSPPLVRPSTQSPAIGAQPARTTSAEMAPQIPPTAQPAVHRIAPIAPQGEALQIVRVRVPREALEAIGFVLPEPDTPAVVDVDVVVGEDGLPLHIRRIRAPQEH